MKRGYLSEEAIHQDEFFLGETDGRVGGIVTFIGTPRENSHGREVRYLEYEAYETMAERVMAQLVAQAASQWAVWEIHVRHRVGRVAVGEPSVVIQVAASHRREAFQASEFLIDEIKRQVPIWKKEIYADGGYQWMQCEHLRGESCGLIR